MNPASALGPDVAPLDLSSHWVYVVGPITGAALAVPAALRRRALPTILVR